MSTPLVAQSLAVPATGAVGEAFLAADVGGTHARLAMVCPGADKTRPVTILDYHIYLCAEWPSLLAVFGHFMARAGIAVRRGVVASAGYVLDDEIVNKNLPWPVSISELRDGLGLQLLTAVNDFEAVTYAASFVGPEDTAAIVEGDGTAPDSGPLLVMGPGTGFGMAALLKENGRFRVLPSEPGQLSLAPGNELEREIHRRLSLGRDRVCYEDVLSGPGLLHLYQTLCHLQQTAPRFTMPGSVSKAALSGGDARASAALEVFCGLLGSFAGDLVLAYRARGVYLAGGILPGIKTLLMQSDFRSRFLAKGVMRPLLEKVDVRLLEHGRWGVVGAAGLFLDGHTH